MVIYFTYIFPFNLPRRSMRYLLSPFQTKQLTSTRFMIKNFQKKNREELPQLDTVSTKNLQLTLYLMLKD